MAFSRRDDTAGLPMTVAEARKRVMGWLARREHSAQEVRQKLSRLACPSPVADTVVAQLAQEGLLSDDRFAEILSRSRFRRGFGPSRIQAELRRHGVDEETVALYGSMERDQLLRQAYQTMKKRFGERKPRNPREKAQRARFLSYKGYPADVIFRVLDAGGEDDLLAE